MRILSKNIEARDDAGKQATLVAGTAVDDLDVSTGRSSFTAGGRRFTVHDDLPLAWKGDRDTDASPRRTRRSRARG